MPLRRPSETTLPTGTPYAYHVNDDLNVLRQFSDAMTSAGLGHGFYYSLTNNFYMNVFGHYVKNSTLLPGQVKVGHWLDHIQRRDRKPC